MHWKCLLGHTWINTKQKPYSIFERDNSVRPRKQYTSFLYECKNCIKLKVVKIDGDWVTDFDDDDDGNGPPDEPVLSPDDFYAKICKE